MTIRRRPGLSAPQKQELWERWKRGQSMNEIAHAFGKERGSIHSVLSVSRWFHCGGGMAAKRDRAAEWVHSLHC